jgi:hypothetical protein
MSPERIAKLEALSGWVWEAREERWEEGFGYLKAFVEAEGHANVSTSYQTKGGYRLGQWVSNQRAIKAKLSPERTAKLEALPGWVWDIIAGKWEQGFQQLEVYIEREGHARVPQSFKTSGGYSLGRWVTKQRSRKAQLSQERRLRLEDLPGWVWGVRN